MKILIVEDDRNSRILLEKALSTGVYSVESAVNGVIAMEKARQSCPDIIISDIRMPEMDGFELCSKIKRDEQLQSIPFIFYTATHVDSRDRKLGLSLGASRFVVKPMDRKEFFKVIAEVLTEHRTNKISVPNQTIADDNELTGMYSEALARKLDKKIKDLEKQQAALQESEERYRSLIENIDLGIALIDREHRIVMSNTAQGNLFRKHPRDFIGKHCYSEFEKRDTICDHCPGAEAMSTGEQTEAEAVGVRDDGSKFTVFIKAFPVFGPDGTATGCIEVVEDITERRKAEEALRLTQYVVDHSSEALFWIEQDAKFFYVNEAACRSLGYSRQELLTMTVFDIDTVFPRDKWGKFWEKLRQKGGSTGETLLRRKDGTIYPVEITANYVEFSDKAYNCSFTRDITQRKQSEEELEQHRFHLENLVEERTSELLNTNKALEREIAERKLAEAESLRASQLASLGELAAGVAHEINNPINGVINYSQILMNQSTPGTKEHDIAIRIIKESDRIAGIVNKLLSFAHAREEGKSPVKVSKVISEALSLTESQLRQDCIIVKINLSSTLPSIFAQPQQLVQVFLNILSNSRYALNQKYNMAHMDKVIEVTVKEKSIDDHPYIHIIFHDNGTGIPDDQIGKLLDPFFSTKPSGEGTGLGLSISHDIIAEHGGSISFDSVTDEYTKVNIYLPIML